MAQLLPRERMMICATSHIFINENAIFGLIFGFTDGYSVNHL